MRELKNLYNQMEPLEDFEGISKTFINEAVAKGKAVEPTPEKAKHMIKNDLRDAIPPQLYELIAKVTSAIESVAESEQNLNKPPSNTSR